jgi:hypothetical protein
VGLTIYTRHPAASTLRLEVEEAKVEVNPINGMITVMDPETGDFIANISGTDFVLMVTDKVAVTETAVVAA